ncbi:MAG TPA: O-antigen ligase family protein [Longimicrobiales bacterium]
MLLLAVAVSILTYVWRVQDLYPILATVKLPILASLAMYGLYVMDGDPRRKLNTIRHPVTACVIAIVALAVASVPTSLYQGLSFGFIKDDLSKNFLLMIILAASIRTLEDVRRYAAFIVIGGAIYAQFVYLNLSIGPSGRLGNIVYYDANDLGMLLVCSLPLAVFFVLRGRTLLGRAAAALCIGLFVLVIIKTGSRGAFLGLLGVGGYLLLAFRSVPVKVRMAAVGACLALLLLAGNDTYWSMMRTLLHPTQDYNWSGNSEAGRMEVWKRGIGYMLSRPVTGVGVRAFPVAEGTISPLAERQEYGIGLKWSAAHNSFVEIGAELGIGGLVALVLLLVHAYRTARSIDPAPGRGTTQSDEVVLGHALAGTIIGYVICGFFLSQAYAAYMFVVHGVIVGLAKVTGVRSVHGRPAVADRVAGAHPRQVAARIPVRRPRS